MKARKILVKIVMPELSRLVSLKIPDLDDLVKVLFLLLPTTSFSSWKLILCPIFLVGIILKDINYGKKVLLR